MKGRPKPEPSGVAEVRVAHDLTGHEDLVARICTAHARAFAPNPEIPGADAACMLLMLGYDLDLARKAYVQKDDEALVTLVARCGGICLAILRDVTGEIPGGADQNAGAR